MITRILYKTPGATSFGLTGEVPTGYVRLVADDGKALTDGVQTVSAIDIVEGDAKNWVEQDSPPPEPADTDPENVIAEMEALYA